MVRGNEEKKREYTAAIIGLNWGVRMHVPALRQAGWQVKMLCGKDPARTSEVARRADIEEFTVNIEDVVERNYDLIVVALPWHLHSSVYALVMQSSSHLLVEHPLTTEPKEASIIASQAELRKQFNWVNFPTRYMKPANSIATLLSRGELGRIRQVEHQFYYPLNEEYEWLPLFATHSLDLAHWLFGLNAPTEVVMSGIAVQDRASCPTWSWPLCCEGLKDGTTINAQLLKATFSIEGGGSYTLTLGHYNDDDFVETLVVESELASVGYESRLNRENEFSPWTISPLWIRKPGCNPKLEPAKTSPGYDAWFDAHVLQATEMAAILNEQSVSTMPASFSDAARAYELLEQVVALGIGIEHLPKSLHGGIYE